MMRFTIRPGGSSSAGGFAVSAYSAREALAEVRDMLARDYADVQVTGEDDAQYDVAQLERLAADEIGEAPSS